MYRPQFAYSTPAGCRDLDHVYYFDGSNTPLLNQSIAGLTVPNIPLILEQDAPFYWRGIKVNADRELSGGTPSAYVIPDFSVRFEDCYFNKLSDDYVPATQYGFPMNPWSIQNAQLTGPPVPFPAEIYCPPGGVILAFVNASGLASGGLSHFVSFSLYGVKRFKECF